MASLFIRAVSIITIYHQRNVAPIRNAIRRETNQLDLQLSVAGALRQSTGVVSDSFFESDRTASEAVGSVVYDEIQLKRTAQTKQLYRRERR